MCVDENFSRIYDDMLAAGLPPLLVMGDDDYFPVSDKIENQIDKMAEIALEELGMVINPPKTADDMFVQKFTDETLPEGQYWTPFPRIVSKSF